jgi:hypothetical protein
MNDGWAKKRLRARGKSKAHSHFRSLACPESSISIEKFRLYK